MLEHALNPVVMLNSWIALVKPGGHIVATVPQFGRYEKNTFPSKFNGGHVSVWVMGGQGWLSSMRTLPVFCRLPDWLEQFDADILLCHEVTVNYDESLGDDIDQTFEPERGCEICYEFVLKKP